VLPAIEAPGDWCYRQLALHDFLAVLRELVVWRGLAIWWIVDC
jgi:hypothetical protein